MTKEEAFDSLKISAKEFDEAICKAFPLLYRDRHGDMRSTCMCWGFDIGPGWFDIVWKLSEQLEPLIQNQLKNPDTVQCVWCTHTQKDHGNGRCTVTHPDSKFRQTADDLCGCGEDPNASSWNGFQPAHAVASQVKEKFGGLRFYVDYATEEMYELIRKAEQESYHTCEFCGSPGHLFNDGWSRTLCDDCHSKKVWL